jgi:transglutaminase-like putative cysteine protease
MVWRRAAQGFQGLITLLAALALCAALAVPTAYSAPADGAAVFGNDRFTIDASHAGQGYVLVRHEQTENALKLRIAKGDCALTYDLEANGEYAAFPLTLGDGLYTLEIYQRITGTEYTLEASFDFSVMIEDENLPFLHPNQYVWYTPESKAAAKAARLCEGLSTDMEKLGAVRAYVAGHIAYDYALAQTVKSGYLPSVDDVLEKGRGICFDYAALTACMLRSQGIPAQLVIGYADQRYHAWNNVLADGQWLLVDTAAEANDIKVTRYTEERIY